MDKYTPTIGIETHVQLKTKTKLFSAVSNDARQAGPNTLISHIETGMPGALPVLNKAAIELAVRAAYALNTKPQKFSKFDRKHYFYPDLPKGYQITQYEDPIIIGGHVVLPDGKEVGITRVHLEEDAGKNIHPAGADYSLVDLNRAGTPLLEIVSEPDIHSAAQAKAYARELWLIMKYADVTDGDLYHGHVRFDVNVSLSTDPAKPGIRAEIKNLNSFRSVENAVSYEIKRQAGLLDKGEPVVQETRGWDEAKQKTTAQRGKEEAQDYRYMPEPDVPPIKLTDDYLEKIKETVPILPSEYRVKLKSLDISSAVVEDLLNNKTSLELTERILQKAGSNHARRTALWMVQSAKDEKVVKAASTNQSPITDESFIKLSSLVESGALSSTAAKSVLGEMLATSDDPELIANGMKLIQVSDETEIEKIVDKVLSANQQAAEDVKNGETKAIGFLVGQVMTQSQGKANPQLAQEIIKKQLGL